MRDALLGLEPADYDIATSARPGEILALFPRSDEVGAHFGVIIVREKITSFRSPHFVPMGPILTAATLKA